MGLKGLRGLWNENWATETETGRLTVANTPKPLVYLQVHALPFEIIKKAFKNLQQLFKNI
jgi:hypothetical protein